MSKLLILLLFVAVLNEQLDGITVYDVGKLTKLMPEEATLNVNEGDEFYLKFSYYSAKRVSFVSNNWKFVNYNEIPDALESFSKNGEAFKLGEIKNGFIGQSGYAYYKFKALKPSYNQITLKFNYYESGRCFGTNANYIKNIKINILSKK